ncbi:DUF202 domain-containing protein [Candidatus Woesearchaeota archaeon]|nr:DUF202 domain-containing protein [Candidatus Woesearchaeota archaeon]
MKPKISHLYLLARERTLFANERTMLAHVRTAFASFLFGIAIIKLFEQFALSLYLGSAAIIAGLIFLVFGLVYYPIRNRRIRKY